MSHIPCLNWSLLPTANKANTNSLEMGSKLSHVHQHGWSLSLVANNDMARTWSLLKSVTEFNRDGTTHPKTMMNLMNQWLCLVVLSLIMKRMTSSKMPLSQGQNLVKKQQLERRSIPSLCCWIYDSSNWLETGQSGNERRNANKDTQRGLRQQ